MKIAFIGGGVMAEAMISGLLKKGAAAPASIWASDISPARRTLLSERYGVSTTTGNREAAARGETVVLAVKPQTLPEVMAELSGKLEPGRLVFSIVAGASLATLSRGLNHGWVVRVMPNMPAQIGEGISVWTATSAVTDAQRQTAQTILAALGRELYVPDEKFVDMATAVSGSGPAYIFLIIEALVDGAVRIGLPQEMARELVLDTVLGSARFAQQSGKHPAELRNLVTSPGGTTAEGLLKLEEGGLRAAMAQAIMAAYDKAIALKGASGR